MSPQFTPEQRQTPLPISTVARALELPTRTLQDWIAKKFLPVTGSGRKRYITIDDTWAASRLAREADTRYEAIRPRRR
ncbi:helix-turn-helix domain-containing protein [Agromyces atrinae]|uniref:helix-turn-helix domain-containing protein n=1 Tax=Agromyces atrinae TaxID=592376 RepID=UPI001F5AAFD4|nr:helix-turn-helix domain-containing protein [Agromyces atrinae]MCI2958229.1 helix-turn-helix domain-containing protein [Agromyces atrinae]